MEVQKAQEMCEIVYPCAACKIHRRKCGDKCPLAPYFPPNDPYKFSLVNKLYGTSKIVKILQDIPVEKRGDAVNSLVYEASIRVHDPIYGCSGTICRLQKQVLELQSQLEITQADLQNKQANFVSLMNGFYNWDGEEYAFPITQGLVQDNDEFIVLQDDQDLFGFESTPYLF